MKTTKISKSIINKMVLESVNKILKEDIDPNQLFFTNRKIIVSFQRNDRGKWTEGTVYFEPNGRIIPSEAISKYIKNWGHTSYMSYLTPSDLQTYLERDYPESEWIETGNPKD